MPRRVKLGDEFYLETSKANPCPVCGHNGYCLVHEDGGKAVCPFLPSSRKVGEAGYLHLLGEQQVAVAVKRLKKAKVEPEGKKFTMADMEALHRAWAASTKPGDLPELAGALGLPVSALKALRAVKCQNHHDLPYSLATAFAFPMYDALAGFCGLRIRDTPTRRKWALGGSSNGLFIPTNTPERLKQLFCVEGPTDTAAGVACNLPIIGRASCNTGLAALAVFCRRHGVQHVGFISDRDAPNKITGKRAGWEWATRMRDELPERVPGLKAVAFLLPAKDLREFYCVEGERTAKLVYDLYQNAGGYLPWMR